MQITQLQPSASSRLHRPRPLTSSLSQFALLFGVSLSSVSSCFTQESSGLPCVPYLERFSTHRADIQQVRSLPPPPTSLKDCMPTAPPTYPEFGPVTRVNWTFLLTCRRIWQPNFRICSGSELFPEPRGDCQVPSPCILKGSRLWCCFLTSHAHTKISQRFAPPLPQKTEECL